MTLRRAVQPAVCRALLAVAVIGAPAAAIAQPPEPAITVVLTDHHFRLSAPVEPGPLRWHIRNEGSEPHQAVVIRLPDGVNEYQERAWYDHGSKGDEPGEPAGGVQTVAPGAEASFRTDLKPGRYLLLCAMSEDAGRHYELGMLYRFTIE